MGNTEHEQRAHDIVERLAITAVQLCDSEECEGERDYVEEVGVATDCDVQWVWGWLVGGVGGVFGGLEGC